MVEPRAEQKKQWLGWNEFDLAIGRLTRQIKRSKKKFKYIVGIPRGGLVVAVALSHRLKLPLKLNMPVPLTKQKILVADDIVDSGKTLERFKGMKIATIFWKEKSIVKPDFYYSKLDEKTWMIFPWEEPWYSFRKGKTKEWRKKKNGKSTSEDAEV